MADPSSRTGAHYGDAAILKYLDGLHAPHDEALEAAYSAPDRTELWSIQLGPNEARLLELLMRWTGVRKVVEVGTLAGYSGLRLARGLPKDGHLWTIDNDPLATRTAQAHFEQAGLADRITCLQGAARDLLPTLASEHGPFDAVFIDADKGAYDYYGQWARENVRPGGLLIADNVYLFGNLLEDSDRAAAVRRFHEEASQHFETVCIPTPDGLLVGRRHG